MTTPEDWARQVEKAIGYVDTAEQIEELFRLAIMQAFGDGFMSGATAYANIAGHSTLMRDNKTLCSLRDGIPERLKRLFDQETATAKEKPCP